MALSHLVTGVGSFCYGLLARLTFVPVCYVRERAQYQPVSEMSEVTDLLKAWMEETRKQELRHEEERRRYKQERKRTDITNKNGPKKDYDTRNL